MSSGESQPLSDHASTPQSRGSPQLPPLSRHHSRSSSQLATLASLAFSPTSPTSPRQSNQSVKTVSPRSSQYGLTMSISPRSGPPSEARRRDSMGQREQLNETNTLGSSEGTSHPSTSSSPGSASRKSALSDRRKTLPSMGFPSPLSHLISAASTPSPLPSPDQNRPSTSTSSASSSSSNSFSPDTRQALASLPPTDPTASAQTSFPSSSIGLAQLIQQKRRQASAPYFHTARTHQQRLASSPISSSNEFGSGFTVMSGGGTGGSTSWNGGWGGPGGMGNPREGSAIGSPESGTISPPGGVSLDLGPSGPPSRSRSRHGSRRSTTSGRLSLQTSGLHLALSDLGLSPGSMSLPENGEEGMVMTPTTEEWRSLGGKLSELADLRAKDEERLRKKEEERIAMLESKEQERRERVLEQNKPTVKRKRDPLKPSLWDVSSDEDDEDESSDDLGLSLSLSRFTANGKKKKQPLSSSPPPPPPPAPPEKLYSSSSNATSETATSSRPIYSHVPKSSFSYSSTKGGTAGGFISHSNTSSLSSIATPLSAPANVTEDYLQQQTGSKAPGSEPLPAVETFKPTHRPQKSESSVQLNPTNIARPALSRGSLTSATGGLSSPPIVINQEDQGSRSPPKGLGLPKIPLPPNIYRSLEEGLSCTSSEGGTGTPLSTAPTPAIDQERPLGLARASSINNEVSTPYEPPFAPPSPARDETGAVITAVDLDWTKLLGPVDPRTYSAVTGLRDIHSFVVEREEAGKGAYGSVRRAREKGPDGQPIGPELIIKYVIKQRILADCWKKHKILGPIPIEVHVLDHLRRVPYVSRPRLRYVNAARQRRDLSGVTVSGARKRNGPGASLARRDSGKAEVDLWNGGEDGSVVATGHPNVCGLLDFFEDGEFYYLVMPQATASATSSSTSSPGQDLFDFVDLHPTGLPPGPVARILSQVADALAFLHEHSIVHRDIKDENVVLDADGNVRLIDFGSAAYVKEGRFFDTFSGTLDFAAPEVLKGSRYSGREQDVWALGVLGYVLICGECPFWSPEEAMQGLAPGSRAFAQLQLKLPDSNAKVESISGENALSEERGDPLEEDFSMADAVDLVTRCLEIDLSLRPSADAVCDHTFLAGEGGWRGRRGWDLVESGGEEEGA